MKPLLKFPMFLKQKKMDICLEFWAFYYTAVFSVVTQRSWRSKNGCVADYAR